MKLVDKDTYREIETILENAYQPNLPDYIKLSLHELDNFFGGTTHYEFMKRYYYERDQYKYRYAKKKALFKKIYRELYVEEPTLYQIKKEVIYKAAMIFYKNGVLK